MQVVMTRLLGFDVSYWQGPAQGMHEDELGMRSPAIHHSLNVEHVISLDDVA